VWLRDQVVPALIAEAILSPRRAWFGFQPPALTFVVTLMPEFFFVVFMVSCLSFLICCLREWSARS